MKETRQELGVKEETISKPCLQSYLNEGKKTLSCSTKLLKPVKQLTTL